MSMSRVFLRYKGFKFSKLEVDEGFQAEGPEFRARSARSIRLKESQGSGFQGFRGYDGHAPTRG